MGYVLIDDGMGEHPKIEALSDKDFRAFFRALCWSSRRQTDGHIPPHVLGALQMTKPQAARLVAAGVFDHGDDGGWVIHGYLDHNPPADPEARKRWFASRRQRKRRGHMATAEGEEGSWPEI